MESPLGPTLANAFLCHFEKQWLSDCPQDFCPNIYRRYVDGIFVTFNSHEQLERYVEHMNTKHLNIKFTFEHEHNNTFSLLAVKICCENNKLTTSVYRKSTFTGVFISEVLYPQFRNLVLFTLYFIVALISLLLMKKFIMKCSRTNF